MGTTRDKGKRDGGKLFMCLLFDRMRINFSTGTGTVDSSAPAS